VFIMQKKGDELMKDGSASMFETVKDHENRIVNLEKIEKEAAQRIKMVEEQAVKLENTILNENRDTRSTMKEQTEKLFALVENAMDFQSTRTNQSHELKMLKWNTFSTVFLKLSGGLLGLLSSGGAIYYMIQHYLK
ncbi:hypothetical protein, partial [Viridibacillus arvi]|uniref:hypothetical protein n=1 Tax=Viridibacillus arvi TaxID=263475 RepID=UPI003D278327